MKIDGLPKSNVVAMSLHSLANRFASSNDLLRACPTPSNRLFPRRHASDVSSATVEDPMMKSSNSPVSRQTPSSHLSFPNEAAACRKAALAAAFTFGLSIASTPVVAAGEAGASNAAADETPYAFQEIVVTARRREENMQTVPIAITAVTDETLRANNIQTFGELQYLVPSLSTSSATTRDALNVSIRGQGLNSATGLPGVIAYLNEVPIPTDADSYMAGGPGLLFDLENVQVLKGPQGTLFGRNSVGGALIIQTAKPKPDFGGRLQVGLGNYNTREIDGALNIPLIGDTLLSRTAFNGQLRDGFTHVLSDPAHPNGVWADDRNYWSLRESLSFNPNEKFQNDTVFTYQKYRSHGSPFILTEVNPAGLMAALYPNALDLLAQQRALGVRASVGTYSVDNSDGSLAAVSNVSRVTLGDQLTFKNIVGYDDAKQSVAVDADGTPLPMLETPYLPRRRTARQVSEEAQLLGKSFDGKFEWITGAFFLSTRQLKTEFYDVIFGGPASGETWASDRSKAVFAQGTYDLSSSVPGLKLSAGARYTWDDRFFHGGPVGGPYSSSEEHDKAPTWTLAADWQVTPATMLYVTSRRGYRAGGSNGVDTQGVARFPDFAPEFVTDAELGVKSDLRLGSVPVRVNAAGYYQRYSDIQVQRFVEDVGSSITQNAAAARLWGIELETIAKLTSNLQFGGFLSYVHFKYTEFQPGVDSELLIAQRGPQQRKYGLNASYRLPIAPTQGEFTVRANWNWQSKSLSGIGLVSDSTAPGAIAPAFGVLNLSADWNRIHDSSLDASLYVSNATDKVYGIGGLAFYNFLGVAVQRYGEPRMYGVRIRYNFGGANK